MSARLTRAEDEAVGSAIDDALAELGRDTGVARVYVIEFSGDVLTNTHEWTAEGIRPVIDSLQAIPMATIGPLRPSLARGDAVQIPSVADLPPSQADFRAFLEAQDIRSLLAVPFMLDGHCVGLLGFDMVDRARHFDDAQVALLRATADLVSAARERQEAATRLRSLTTQLPGIFYQYVQRADGSAYTTWIGGGDAWIAAVDRERMLQEHADPLEVVHPSDRPRITSSLRRASLFGTTWSDEFRVRSIDGTARWFWGRAHPERRSDGSVLWHGYAVDVTEQHQTRRALERSEANLRALLRFTNAVISDDLDETFYQRLVDEAIALIVDAQAGSLLLRDEDGRYRYVASRDFDLDALRPVSFGEDELGLQDAWTAQRVRFAETNQELGAERFEQLRNSGQVERIAISLVVPIRHGGHLQGTLTLDNFERADAFGAEATRAAEGMAAQAAIALQRFELEARLRAERARFEHLSRHDPLTDLGNRALFFEQLERVASMTMRHEFLAGLIFLDLDGFKRVNDTLGHAAGDAVLRMTARRLEAEVRAEDVVARLGGDEFAVLLARLEHEEDVVAVAEKLVASLARPHVLYGETITVHASVGTVVIPRDGQEPDELLARADRALYRVKARGGGGVASSAIGDALDDRHDRGA
ncbi:MAG: diguanylate cyclase [Trueperaceae bacterium]|nr:diguanylate cyclase [Trueperaceae bacterium]